MADINFDCPHCGQNLETDEVLSGTGIDCPVCKKYLTIPGSSTTTELINIGTGKNVSDLLSATELAAKAAKAANAAKAAKAAKAARAADTAVGDGDSRAVLDQLAKRAAKSVIEKKNANISKTNTQLDSVDLSKFEYKATNPATGVTERGEISASDLIDASNRLMKMGLEATSINQREE